MNNRIEQVLKPLSSFKREQCDDSLYEIHEIVAINEISVFVRFLKDKTVLEYWHTGSYNCESLTGKDKRVVDDSLILLNTLSPRGKWCFKETEKIQPEDEDLSLLTYTAEWPISYSPEEIGREIFSEVLMLGDIYGFLQHISGYIFKCVYDERKKE